ncbi:MAG: hypothetical protein AVDCRST_MAG61-3241, partial [uncultured Friedmanniella sp.]
APFVFAPRADHAAAAGPEARSGPGRQPAVLRPGDLGVAGDRGRGAAFQRQHRRAGLPGSHPGDHRRSAAQPPGPPRLAVLAGQHRRVAGDLRAADDHPWLGGLRDRPAGRHPPAVRSGVQPDLRLPAGAVHPAGLRLGADREPGIFLPAEQPDRPRPGPAGRAQRWRVAADLDRDCGDLPGLRRGERQGPDPGDPRDPPAHRRRPGELRVAGAQVLDCHYGVWPHRRGDERDRALDHRRAAGPDLGCAGLRHQLHPQHRVRPGRHSARLDRPARGRAGQRARGADRVHRNQHRGADDHPAPVHRRRRRDQRHGGLRLADLLGLPARCPGCADRHSGDAVREVSPGGQLDARQLGERADQLRSEEGNTGADARAAAAGGAAQQAAISDPRHRL